MPQPAAPAGHGEHDEDPTRARLSAQDFEFEEEETLAEADLTIDSEEDEESDWFDDDEGDPARGDELGAGDDDFDPEEDGEDLDFDDEADGEFGDGEDDDEAAGPYPDESRPVLEQITATIREQQLFAPATDRVLVAVSGGKDSVVLLDALHRLGVAVGVAHCHFGLRGEAADQDAEFVRKLAKKLGVPFYLEHFATQQFAAQEKISVQMAARALRYAWFERLADQHGYAVVATAHHRADLAETILLNLTRGTGLAGLHGIAARTGRVVRPLINCSVSDLHAYLAARQVTWREDASNQDLHYRRNRLRHDVLPVLRELNPNLDETLALSAERVRQAEALVAREVAQVAEADLRVAPEAVYLRVDALQHTPATALLLGELLRPYGFDYALSRRVAGALGAVAGTRFESPTHRLVVDRGQLVITPKDLRAFGTFELAETATELPLAGGRRLTQRRVAASATYKLPRGANATALDAEKLRYPLTIRPWAAGDWLIPLGMRGKQKVSDLLINQKVPANLKDRVLVVVSANGSLAWVVGQRVDDRFKVTADTTDVVELTVV